MAKLGLSGFKQFLRLESEEDFCFFFTKDGQLFGAPEESRLVFARMKNPEPGDESWVKEASFLAALLGPKKSEKIFTAKDLKTIKVASKEDAEKMLKK